VVFFKILSKSYFNISLIFLQGKDYPHISPFGNQKLPQRSTFWARYEFCPSGLNQFLRVPFQGLGNKNKIKIKTIWLCSL